MSASLVLGYSRNQQSSSVAFKGVLCVEDKQDSAMTGVVVHVDSNAICVDEGKTEGDQ